MAVDSDRNRVLTSWTRYRDRSGRATISERGRDYLARRSPVVCVYHDTLCLPWGKKCVILRPRQQTAKSVGSTRSKVASTCRLEQ